MVRTGRTTSEKVDGKSVTNSRKKENMIDGGASIINGSAGTGGSIFGMSNGNGGATSSSSSSTG